MAHAQRALGGRRVRPVAGLYHPARELLRAGDEKLAPPRLRPERDEHAERERPWRVGILHRVFKLGWARSVLVMARAHTSGRAEVAVLPRHEASTRVAAAHARARADGWPLRFTQEPAD